MEKKKKNREKDMMWYQRGSAVFSVIYFLISILKDKRLRKNKIEKDTRVRLRGCIYVVTFFSPYSLKPQTA